MRPTPEIPQWLKEGWTPCLSGGMCKCPKCGAKVSTNALARAAHKRACPGKRT